MFFRSLLPEWVVFLAFSLPAFASATCSPPQFVAPSQFETISTPKPTIVWTPVASAQRYEVSIESRVPEGEIIQRVSSNVELPSFTSPAPLASDRAIVSVTVRTKCNDNETSAAAERVFVLDMRNGCPGLTGLSSKRIGKMLRVEWERNPLVDRVEVRMFEGASASARQSESSSGTHIALEFPENKVWVVGLRNHCRQAVGAWQWIE